MAVRADHVTLGHLLFDLVPRAAVGNKRGHTGDLDPAHVIPIETPSPLGPSEVGAATLQPDLVVAILRLESASP